MSDEPLIEKQTALLKDGQQVEYYVGGDETGRPVVLLHGGGTDHAMLSWREAVPALLRSGFKVYAPNYPGYGGSPLGSQPATVENITGWVEELMDLWGVPRAALIGISMGGAVGIGYTLRHPKRVERLVIIGSYGIQDEAPFHRLSYFLVRMPRLMNAIWAATRGSRWAARYSLKSILHNPQARTEAIAEEVYEAMQNLESQKAFGQMQRDEILWKGLKTNFSERLCEIAIPVLIIHGEKDAGVPVRYAERAAALLPNARLKVIGKAGHWTQRDYPGEFNRLVLDFLGEQEMWGVSELRGNRF